MSPKTKLSIIAEEVQELEHVGLCDFEILYDLAASSTAMTTLVRSFVSGRLCVLKSLRKHSASKQVSTPHIWPEQAILESLKSWDAPFLVNLQSSFQDREYYYLVTVRIFT